MSDRGAEDSGGLVSRNVTINGRRTSLRLEPAMWDALAEIAKREGISLNEVDTSGNLLALKAAA